MLDLENKELDFNNYDEVLEFLIGSGHRKEDIDSYCCGVGMCREMAGKGLPTKLEMLDYYIHNKRKQVLGFLKKAGAINYEVNTVKDYYYLDGGKDLYILNNK